MSVLYRFTPNDWARQKFNLAAADYRGEGVTPLLIKILGGERAFDKYAIASDPFAGEDSTAHIAIMLPPEEAHENTQGRVFPLIGVMERLSI